MPISPAMVHVYSSFGWTLQSSLSRTLRSAGGSPTPIRRPIAVMLLRTAVTMEFIRLRDVSGTSRGLGSLRGRQVHQGGTDCRAPAGGPCWADRTCKVALPLLPAAMLRRAEPHTGRAWDLFRHACTAGETLQ